MMKHQPTYQSPIALLMTNNMLTSNTAAPKLSVLLVTYNHENFIRQALDSVLMQRTDFDFEIVVADDYSQDSTLAIIGEYQANNQHIRILQSERNVGITRNYQRGLAACRGEYVAVLEGDDFWIAPIRLASMVAFLDQHQECAFCFHRFIRHDETSNGLVLHPQFEVETEFELLTASQLARENFVGNFSACVYRREVIDTLDPGLFEMKAYDWILNIAIAQGSMVGYLPTIMSVYRVHPAGAWSAKSLDEWRPELLELIDTYNKYLNFKFDAEFRAYKSALLAEVGVPSGNEKPKVSVLLVTYNQEKFIHEALNSVIMQNTDFAFEIVVADDHSDDSTLTIVKEYQTNHPNIRILPAAERIGITRNYQRGFAACRGEYIAVLEGDDFWISPKKLELASTFLDQHPECVLCFHRLIRHDEGSDHIMVHPSFGTEEATALFTASRLARENFIGNFSTCTYRREIINGLDPGLWRLKLREWPFNIVVGQHGAIGYVPVILSVYRSHPGGIWSTRTEDEQRPELMELIDTYNEYLDFKLDSEFQAFKHRWLPETPKWAPVKEVVPLGKVRRWIEPFVPPVVVRLAGSIYRRARRRG
jgi:glycosyltransferase involved in cell wall biosynthesis